jgi:hypothetical protein
VITDNLDSSMMLGDYAIDDRKAEAGSPAFSREIGLK